MLNLLAYLAQLQKKTLRTLFPELLGTLSLFLFFPTLLTQFSEAQTLPIYLTLWMIVYLLSLAQMTKTHIQFFFQSTVLREWVVNRLSMGILGLCEFIYIVLNALSILVLQALVLWVIGLSVGDMWQPALRLFALTPPLIATYLFVATLGNNAVSGGQLLIFLAFPFIMPLLMYASVLENAATYSFLALSCATTLIMLVFFTLTLRMALWSH